MTKANLLYNQRTRINRVISNDLVYLKKVLVNENRGLSKHNPKKILTLMTLIKRMESRQIKRRQIQARIDKELIRLLKEQAKSDSGGTLERR